MFFTCKSLSENLILDATTFFFLGTCSTLRHDHLHKKKLYERKERSKEKQRKKKRAVSKLFPTNPSKNFPFD